MDGPTKREKKRESSLKHKDYSVYSKKAVRAKEAFHEKAIKARKSK
jgi:hypothetical protein